MSKLQDLVNVREFKKSDINFILDSFIHCVAQYKESLFKGWEYRDVTNHLEQSVLTALLKLDYSIWIASSKDNEDGIIGYIIADNTINHIFFNYTKYSFRKLGIQRDLLLPLVIDPSKPVTVNYQTKEALKLAKANKVSIVNKFTEQLIERIV